MRAFQQYPSCYVSAYLYVLEAVHARLKKCVTCTQVLSTLIAWEHVTIAMVGKYPSRAFH